MKTFKFMVLFLGAFLSSAMFGMQQFLDQACEADKSSQFYLDAYKGIKANLSSATKEEVGALCDLVKFEYANEGYKLRDGECLIALKDALVPFVDECIADFERALREAQTPEKVDVVTLTAVVLKDKGELAKTQQEITGYVGALVKHRKGLQQALTAVRTEKIAVTRAFREKDFTANTLRAQLDTTKTEVAKLKKAADERGEQLKEALAFIAELEAQANEEKS